MKCALLFYCLSSGGIGTPIKSRGIFPLRCDKFSKIDPIDGDFNEEEFEGWVIIRDPTPGREGSIPRVTSTCCPMLFARAMRFALIG